MAMQEFERKEFIGMVRRVGAVLAQGDDVVASCGIVRAGDRDVAVVSFLSGEVFSHAFRDSCPLTNAEFEEIIRWAQANLVGAAPACGALH